MIGVFGPPPKEMLQASPRAAEFFDDKGNWRKGSVPQVDLRQRLGEMENVDALNEFFSSVLQWDPRKRKTAEELLQHTALFGELPEEDIIDQHSVLKNSEPL